jgi:hypothetical protein
VSCQALKIITELNSDKEGLHQRERALERFKRTFPKQPSHIHLICRHCSGLDFLMTVILATKGTSINRLYINRTSKPDRKKIVICRRY